MRCSIANSLILATNKLKSVSIETARLDAEVILADLLQVKRYSLLIKKKKILDKNIVEEYNKLIYRRTLKEPVAYIIGKKEFMGLDFIVDSSVLIPRCDTEILVEYIIEYSKQLLNQELNILEIGTGSGAICVSLAKYIEKCKITTIDISLKALNIAKQNADKMKVSNKIEFYHGDCFESIKQENKFDIILSNPPYIPYLEIDKLDKDVSQYEPIIALDGGSDGLDFYKKIIKESKLYIRKDGIIAFEIGYNQSDDVEKILKENHYINIKTIKDLSCYDRVIVGYNNSN